MRILAKYRIVSKGKLVTVKSKLSRGEQVSERELLFFEKQLFRGCFRPRMEKKREVIYTAPDVIPMTEYLKGELEITVFWGIVAQTLEMIKKIEANGLFLSNLILDLKFTFVCERTGEVFYIYQPLNSRFSYGNVYNFLEDLLSAVKVQERDNCALKAFRDFMEDSVYYKAADLEAYVRKVCPQAYKKIVSADMGKSGFITNDKIEYKNHYGQTGWEESGTTLLSEETEDEGATTLLCEEGTMVLMQEANFPELVRKRTEEKIAVDKDVFLVGKESDCDFQISDNRAVSRRHLTIEKINGVYYVTDKNSTNHTYVNGQMLGSGVPCELRDGDVIGIADEEFEFIR